MSTCKIGTTNYDSLQAAINAASIIDIITLLEANTEDVTIIGKNITLELDGFSYKGGVKLSSGGKLTIGDDYVEAENGSITTSYDGGFKNILGSEDIDQIITNANNIIVNGGSGSDYIENYGKNVTINAGAGDCDVYNIGVDASIDGGAGNDFILNEGSNVTIHGDAGEDSIFNEGSNVTINGGADNDTLYTHNGSSNVTMDGGTGDDFIHLDGSNTSGNVIKAGEGDDTISGYISGAGTINVTYTKAEVSGNDVILTTSKGTVLILNAAEQTINLNGTDTVISVNSTDTPTDTPTDTSDDKNVCKIGKTEYKTLQAAIDAAKNKDTITLLKANTENIKVSDKNINIALGDYSYKGNATLSGGKLTIGDDYVEVKSGTVTTSYDGRFKKVIGSDSAEEIKNQAARASVNGGGGNDTITNTGNNVSIDGGAGNDLLVGGNGAEVFVVDEGNNTISGIDENDVIEIKQRTIDGVVAKGNDMILTLDNGDLLTVENAKGKTVKVSDVYTNKGGVKMQFGDGELSVTADDVHHVETDGTPAKVKVDSNYKGNGVFNLSNHNFNDNQNPSFYGNIKDLDASAYDGKATLIGNENGNEIKASKGNSLLNGGAGDDTLVGGDGADTFTAVTGNGNDLIKNFKAGTGDDADKIVINGVIDTVNVEGKNIVLSIDGNDKVTVEGIEGNVFLFENEYTAGKINMNIADKELNVKEDGYYLAVGEDATVKLAEYSGKSKVIDLNNGHFEEKDNITFYGNDKIKELDASDYAGDIALYGNDKDNVIKAGSGNDTLWGGAGNDTLIGGNGEDTFIYKPNNGNDEVQNAGKGDCIKLDGIDVNWCTKVGDELFVGNDVKFEFADGGSFLVKNGQADGITYEVEGKTYSVVKTASGSHWQEK